MTFEPKQLLISGLWCPFAILLRHVASGGRGSLVVKVTDLWSVSHEFEHSAAEEPPCRGAMYVKSVDTQTSSCQCDGEFGRCGLSWLLPDVLEALIFAWERAKMAAFDWLLNGDDNDSQLVREVWLILASS
ncbi:hypothetical protein TNCV_2610061 [Trichonephila clavipes]|nr:hypothetical protein TNCV_2610061 [Trichonephila clavipes]